MCLAACYWARLSVVYYGATANDAGHAGFDDDFIYDEFLKPSDARSLPAINLLRDEAWASFAAWIDSPHKITY
jgi:tRNA(Arg) A34 adenosine deaminase TadA